MFSLDMVSVLDCACRLIQESSFDFDVLDPSSNKEWYELDSSEMLLLSDVFGSPLDEGAAFSFSLSCAILPTVTSDDAFWLDFSSLSLPCSVGCLGLFSFCTRETFRWNRIGLLDATVLDDVSIASSLRWKAFKPFNTAEPGITLTSLSAFSIGTFSAALFSHTSNASLYTSFVGSSSSNGFVSAWSFAPVSTSVPSCSLSRAASVAGGGDCGGGMVVSRPRPSLLLLSSSNGVSDTLLCPCKTSLIALRFAFSSPIPAVSFTARLAPPLFQLWFPSVISCSLPSWSLVSPEACWVFERASATACWSASRCSSTAFRWASSSTFFLAFSASSAAFSLTSSSAFSFATRASSSAFSFASRASSADLALSLSASSAFSLAIRSSSSAFSFATRASSSALALSLSTSTAFSLAIRASSSALAWILSASSAFSFSFAIRVSSSALALSLASSSAFCFAILVS